MRREAIGLMIAALAGVIFLTLRDYQRGMALHREGAGTIERDQAAVKRRIEALTAERQRLMGPDAALQAGQTWAGRLADLERMKARWLRRGSVDRGEMDRLDRQIAEARGRLRALPELERKLTELSKKLRAELGTLVVLSQKSSELARHSKEKLAGKLWIAGGCLLLAWVLASLLIPGQRAEPENEWTDDVLPRRVPLDLLSRDAEPSAVIAGPFPNGAYPGGWQNVAHPSQAKVVEKCHQDARELMNELHTFSAAPPARLIPRLIALLESVEALPSGARRKLLRLSRQDRRASLSDHVVGVTWRALLRAQGMNFSKSDLLVTGLAAFLHDLARVPWQHQPDHLIPSDVFRQSAQLLDRIPDFEPDLRRAVQSVIAKMGPEGESHPMSALILACHMDEQLQRRLPLSLPAMHKDH